MKHLLKCTLLALVMVGIMACAAEGGKGDPRDFDVTIYFHGQEPMRFVAKTMDFYNTGGTTIYTFELDDGSYIYVTGSAVLQIAEIPEGMYDNE